MRTLLLLALCVSVPSCFLSSSSDVDKEIRCCKRGGSDPQCHCTDTPQGPGVCSPVDETEAASCSTSDIPTTPAVCCDDPGQGCFCGAGSACTGSEVVVASCPPP